MPCYKDYTPEKKSECPGISVSEGFLVHPKIEIYLAEAQTNLDGAKKVAPDFDYSADEGRLTALRNEYQTLKEQSKAQAGAITAAKEKEAYNQSEEGQMHAAMFGPKEEDPIYSDFHRSHMGKIVFSKSMMARENPGGSEGGTYNATDLIYARAFWAHGFANMTMQCEGGDSMRYMERGTIFPYTRIYVDGVMQDCYYDPASFSEFWKASTRQIWLHPTVSDGVTDINWVRIVDKMSPGTHSIRLEYYIRGWNPQKFHDPKAPADCKGLLASGEFTLVKKAGDHVRIGKKWSDFNAVQSNAGLEASFVASAKNYGADDKGYVASSVKIMDNGWRIVKNEVTGVVLYRYMNALFKFTNPEGYCRTEPMEVRQEYIGGTYSSKNAVVPISKQTFGYSGDVDCD